MILSDGDMRKAIAEGNLIITPVPPPENFSTSALDLRVGDRFWRWRKHAKGVGLHINLSTAKVPELSRYAERITPDDNGFVEVPCNGFILCPTLERITLPPKGQLAARVEGRSSLARLGLAVHITAPVIHSGFTGPIVLEFMNHGPHHLRLEANKTVVCQIVLEKLSSRPTGDLDTLFQNQKGPFGKD